MTLIAFQEGRFETYSDQCIFEALYERAFGEKFNQIRVIIERYLQGIDPTSMERTAIVSYLQEEYQNLLVLSLRANASFLRLKTIIDSEVLSTVKKHFSVDSLSKGKFLDLNNILEDVVIEQSCRKWMQKFNILRPDRTFKNSIDAKACAIIRTINENLFENKAVLLLISNSRYMDMTTPKGSFEDYRLVKGVYNDSKFGSGIRNLDYVYYYYVHMGECIEDTLRSIRFTLDMLQRILELAKLGGNSGEQQLVLKKVINLIHRFGNLSICAGANEPLLKWLQETRNSLEWQRKNNIIAGISLLEMIRDEDDITAEKLIVLQNMVEENLALTIESFTAKFSD